MIMNAVTMNMKRLIQTTGAWLTIIFTVAIPLANAQPTHSTIHLSISSIHAFDCNFELFSPLPQSSAAPSEADAKGDLEHLLTQMDKIASGFRTTEANFTWTQYTKVVDESDVQKGRIYFKRNGSDTEMAANIMSPEKKYVVFAAGKVQVYQPRINDLKSYDPGKNKAEFETFLVLGFGGGGHDLLKSFSVEYAGTESVDGVQTAKLSLIPKSPKVHDTFDHIILWIDPTRGVSLKQQLFSGQDYRLAEYSDIASNQKIADSVFKIKRQ